MGQKLQIVDEIQREPMALVKTGDCLLGTDIKAVLRQGDTGRTRTEPVGSIVNGMRPDMRDEQSQPFRESAAEENLQSVIPCIGRRLQLINASKLRISGVERPPLLDCPHRPRQGLIDVPHSE